MDLNQSPVIVQKIAEDVKEWLKDEASGHDWWHIYRVWKMAKHLSREEGADEFITEIAALLHEIRDPKLTPPFRSDPIRYLRENGLNSSQIQRVMTIIDETSFKGADVDTPVTSKESACVQDADRLDAIGAIGIARAFAYGGAKGQPIHDPNIPVVHAASENEYRLHKTTSINHFYEKLLLLKDRLNTKTAKRYGEKRHQFLVQFLQQFQREWHLES